MSKRHGDLAPEPKNLKAFNAKVGDWYGRCRKCGKEMEGTLDALLAHQSECPHGKDTTH